MEIDDPERNTFNQELAPNFAMQSEKAPSSRTTMQSSRNKKRAKAKNLAA